MDKEQDAARTIRIQDLDISVDEAKDLLSALRSGEVDAVVISRSNEERIFTLQSADRPYRLMIESLREGAVTFGSDGAIQFCNPFFAEMVHMPAENLIGMNFFD